MCLDDSTHDRKTESGSTTLGREKGLEHSRPSLGREARSVSETMIRSMLSGALLSQSTMIRAADEQAASEFSNRLRKTCSIRNASIAQPNAIGF